MTAHQELLFPDGKQKRTGWLKTTVPVILVAPGGVIRKGKIVRRRFGRTIKGTPRPCVSVHVESTSAGYSLLTMSALTGCTSDHKWRLDPAGQGMIAGQLYKYREARAS